MTQKTFMMLKPDAFESGVNEQVINELKVHGLQITQWKRIKVDMEVMKTLLEHYQGVIDSMNPSFNFPGKLFNSFYYGEHWIQPMEISYEGEEDLISYSRKLVGKTNPQEADKDTIRGHFSSDNYDLATKEVRLVNNVIHASDSVESAQRELKIWEKYFN